MKTQIKAARTATNNHLITTFNTASDRLTDVFRPNSDMEKRYPELAQVYADALRTHIVIGATQQALSDNGTLWVRLRLWSPEHVQDDPLMDADHHADEHGTTVQQLNDLVQIALLANPGIDEATKYDAMCASTWLNTHYKSDFTATLAAVNFKDPATFSWIRTEEYKCDDVYRYDYIWYPLIKKGIGSTLYNVMLSISDSIYDTMSAMLTLHPYMTVEVIANLVSTSALLNIQPSVLNTFGHFLPDGTTLAYTKSEVQFLVGLYTVRDFTCMVRDMISSRRYITVKALHAYTLAVLEDRD